MKILITTAFPTKGSGSGTLITTQAKSYIEAGHEVVILTGNNRTDFDRVPEVKYHVVPFTGEGENPEKIEGQLPFNFLNFTTHVESHGNYWDVSFEDLQLYCEKFEEALKEEIEQFNPDIIHAQHNWLLSSEATRTGKPVVTTIHGTDLMGYEKSKNKVAEIERKIENLRENGTISEEQLSYLNNEKKKYEFYISESENSARNSRKIIVISDAQKENFVNLFPYASEKVELVDNGYDSKMFYPDKTLKKEDVLSLFKSNKTPDGKIDLDYDKLVLFVGKFADFKGIDSLVTAAKIYEDESQKQGNKILTVIVGSGGLDKKLREQADRIGLSNTHFVGRQPIEILPKLHNIADVSMVPSRDEPFGLVTIEGAACGHPVIGSNSGGIPGILNTTKEQLPNKNIIQTKLGVLVKPLPNRPEKLTANQKERLDYIIPDYVLGDTEEKEKVISTSIEEFSLSEIELRNYFEEYSLSTTSLAEAVIKVVNGEFLFDNNEIAEYTKKTYSQDVITEKLIGLFKEAIENY